MMRVRRVMHICANSAAHHIPRRSTTSVPQDPSTWPKNYSGPEIKHLLESHLKDPSTRKWPNFDLIAELHQKSEFDTVRFLLKGAFKPMPVDVETYLKTYVDDKTDNAAMPLQEREIQLEDLHIALNGIGKRNVAFCYSPSGSGKTQFLKHFVLKKREDAMKCGRVIVRCCHKAQAEPWLKKVLEDRRSNQAPSLVTSTDQGLCELIRTHVEFVTNTKQNTADYTDSATAYATWMRETQDHFDIPAGKGNMHPLIILDTCEVLSRNEPKAIHHAPLHQAAKRYTLLDDLCRAVHDPYGIFVIGCSAKIHSLPDFVKAANVIDIKALAPLNEAAHKKAIVESWNDDVDDDVRESLYHWAGGLPRLLRLAHNTHSVSLARGSLNGFSSCFKVYKDSVNSSSNTNSSGLADTWFPHAYTCLLASSTKATVLGSDLIHVKPEWKDPSRSLTYDEASIQSIGTFISSASRFMVPPISFGDESITNPDAPIRPSLLHPFLTTEVFQHFGKNSDSERGKIFEEPFMYAVYARYLLAYWKEPTKPWVALGKVFEGAINVSQINDMERYETNLTSGVVKGKASGKYQDAKRNAVTYYRKGGNTHHDAYIWCRDKKKKGAEFAVPMQLCHGNEKTPTKLREQLKESKEKSARDVPLLLSVNHEAREVRASDAKAVVKINADAMSSIRWLWLIATKKIAKKKGK